MSGKMNSNELLLDAVAVVVCANVIKESHSFKRNKRRKWCKNWLLERQNFSHINLLAELKLEKKIGLIIYVWMK
jgi:hypothetical protein